MHLCLMIRMPWIIDENIRILAGQQDTTCVFKHIRACIHTAGVVLNITFILAIALNPYTILVKPKEYVVYRVPKPTPDRQIAK